ncbi:hypothetical protein SETIT_8G217100v2 [Setaria italica]|uniref:Disease resistance R13L4/SHOC-2-like LRR domain-containing protein n=1 Tax=Setaria italica TaxID=4555 RepID=A0A368SA87_SETIT|nr:hypothetical protein SETIT_8G217100v2 [Setaria italica]
MTSEESFATVSMPLGIQKMRNIEILSHIQVTNKDSDLFGIAQLLKLRKLGVALRGKHVKLGDTFFQIKKLHKCLRSLSIRFVGTAGTEEVDALPTLPEFIESLNICGITSGLVHSIKDRHQLAKITLSDAYLKQDDLRIIGNLDGLRGLRFQHKSYTGSELAYKKFEFQTPKLERIVWTFATMDALSGIDWLPRLKKLELNGDCDLDPIKEALEGHPNNAILVNNPHQERQPSEPR